MNMQSKTREIIGISVLFFSVFMKDKCPSCGWTIDDGSPKVKMIMVLEI